jgi:hypothetical protein
MARLGDLDDKSAGSARVDQQLDQKRDLEWSVRGVKLRR